MKLRECFRLFLVVPLIYCGCVFAVNFSEMDSWNAETKYERGSVVTYGTDIYIKKVSNSDNSPEESAGAWIKIKYNSYQPVSAHKIYLLGTVVEHNKKYYISKQLNIQRPNSLNLMDNRGWIEFTHPAMRFDLPASYELSEELETLIGIDNNSNGIRDDYEQVITKGGLSIEAKQAALKAGKIYGELIAAGVGNITVDSDMATTILQAVVLAKLCKRKLQGEGGSWSEADYFNTLDRVQVKYLLQNSLSELVDESGFSALSREPCVSLRAY